jgi:electron transport complex protein RnfA
MLVITKAEETASYGYAHALVNALGSGLGFMLAMVLFAGVRGRLETCDIPKSLRGLPITLIAASLLAVSFLGFQGVVDGLFA